MMLIFILSACQSSKLSDTANHVVQDLDGDGFVHWEMAMDASEADCDDNDPTITPEGYRLIPAGSFLRGDPRGENASPQKEINLSDYCMDRYERSNQDFINFLNNEAALGRFNEDELGRPWYDFEDNDDEYPARIIRIDNSFQAVEGYEDHPIVEIYHWAAIAYCQSLNMRLPTEAEWEKAARGEDGRIYPWGDEPPDCSLANHWPRDENGMPIERCVDDTLPQKSLSAGESPYGILNLAGNVSEWTQDLYLADHYENASDTDPVGPEEGWSVDPQHPDGFEAIVARGGSLGSGPGSLRTFHRTAEPLDATSNGLGFRCVFEPK